MALVFIVDRRQLLDADDDWWRRRAVIACWDDPLGRSVTLYQDRFDHIEQDHGDMADSVHLIQAVVEHPAVIRHDEVHPDRESYYRTFPEIDPTTFVKVSVEFEPPDEYGLVVGTVITAFQTPRLKRGELPKWP